MMLRRIIGLTITILLLISCSSKKITIPSTSDFDFGFPILEPIDDADPSIRKDTIFELPESLYFEIIRDESIIKINYRINISKGIKLDIGKNMVFGTHFSTHIRNDQGNLYSFTKGLFGGVGMSDWFSINTSKERDGIPNDDEQYCAEIKLIIFETDIPSQHMWNPRSKNYRELITLTYQSEMF